MKNKLIATATATGILFMIFGFSWKNPENPEPTLKQVLLDQLKSTHNQAEWFVPVNVAIQGLTAEQAMWQDKPGVHSIGQLTHHIIFWNERQLAMFKGDKQSDYNGKNEETFTSFDKNQWADAVKKMDRVLSDWESAITAADEAKLKSWYVTISRISTHNAYHTGQIIYIRKLQGSWDDKNGVK